MPVVGYEGYYEISRDGVVYSLPRKVLKWDGYRMTSRVIIKEQISNCGYCRVALSKDTVVVKYSVHRLVALAFIPNPNNKPHVNHKNGIKTDNRVENLEWISRSENQIHARDVLNVRFGGVREKGKVWYKTKGVQNPSNRAVLMFNKSGELIKEFISITEAAKYVSRSIAQVQLYCVGKRNNKLYDFKYKNNK